MARFDEVFADLNAKMAAVMGVVAQDPVLAAQVKDAIDNAHAGAEIQAGQAADDARANALATSMQTVRQILADVVPAEESSV